MLHRRDAMLRIGQIGLGGLTLPRLLEAEQSLADGKSITGLKPTNGKAKACILIYLWGGPPQMDMWDPNPEAAEGIRSHFAPDRDARAGHPHFRGNAALCPADG